MNIIKLCKELSDKWLGAIKYTTLKPVAHAARALEVLILDFTYAQLLTSQIKNNKSS
jgi:hypothetical protein